MILQFFQDVIAFIITAGILITVHECGHFLAARFLNVAVERFSIGFGPVLWRWKSSKGIEYVVSIILIGGYVKLLDETTKMITDSNQYVNLYNKYIWKRGFIIVAGPVCNIVFAIFLYSILYSIGVPVNRPVVTYTFPDSLAYQSQILPGSQIISINNIQTNDWDDVRLQILNNIKKEKVIISSKLMDNDLTYIKNYIVYLPKSWINQTVINNQDVLITFGFLPNVICVKSTVSKVRNYIFNEQDDLQINDKILLVNNQPIYNLESFIYAVMQNPQKTFKITIDRNTQILNLNFTLYKNNLTDIEDMQDKIKHFMNSVVLLKTIQSEIHRDTLCISMFNAFNKVWDIASITINAFFQLFFGNSNITNLHGPIAIAHNANKLMHSGMMYYFMFLSVISVNLGIINLFPIPMLDGGQLFLLLVEKVINRPIPIKIQNISYIISYVILIIIMFLVFYNDIMLFL